MNLQNECEVVDSCSSTLSGHRNARHQLWREMQDAYDAYRGASDALQALIPQSPFDIPREDQSVRSVTLETEQRAAFEKYIDARLCYSEFERDERFAQTPELDAVVGEQSQDPRIRSRSIERMLLTTANVMLLAVITLGSVYCIRQDGRLGDAVLAREQMRAVLDRTEGDLRELKLSAGSSNPITNSDTSSRSPSTAVIFKKKLRPAGRRSRVAAVNGPRSYSFTLTPSAKFQQVGPVFLSIRDVDPARGYLMLSVIEGSRVSHRMIRLNVPVVIFSPNRMRPMRLAITRIGTNYVHGSLTQPPDNKIEMTANQPHAGLRRGT